MVLLSIAQTPIFRSNRKQDQSHLLVRSYPCITPPRTCLTTVCFKFISFDDIAQVAHNKVLVAATLSAAIGQLSKPFTSSLLYGKNFSLSSAVQAGGFPSTHSSAVIATAVSLALERGFADPIFGLAVVYASLVMYDAQGVRREVGNHAKTLNQILINNVSTAADSSRAETRIPTSFMQNPSSSDQSNLSSSITTSTPLGTPANIMNINASIEEKLGPKPGPLKESIGHTEVEVIAGGLLGFLVSLAVSNIL